MAFAAWILSAGAVAATAFVELVRAPGRPAHVALALLPWIALAGWPAGGSRRRAATRGEPQGALLAVALAAPALALGARLDCAGGAPLGEVLAVLALGAALAGALGLSTKLAAPPRSEESGASPRAGLRATLWLLLVPLPPVLRLAFATAATEPDVALPRLGPVDAWLPLAAGAARGEVGRDLALAFGSAALIVALGAAEGRGRRSGSADGPSAGAPDRSPRREDA